MNRIRITWGKRIAAALGLAGCAFLTVCPAQAAYTTPWQANPGWDAPHVGSGNSRAAPALADVNGDNKLDAVIGAKDGSVYVFFNTGSNSAPTWPSSPSITIPPASSGETYVVPALADLDGDGDYDLLVGNNGGSAPVLAYINNGTPQAPTWARYSQWDVTSVTGLSGYYAPALADLNHDGKVDLLIGGLNGFVQAFENTGSAASPTWTRRSGWDLPGDMPGSYASPALADLDGDGDYDLMLGGALGTVYAFKNVGTLTAPSWQAMGSWFVADRDPNPDTSHPTGYNFVVPALGDLNGDGNVDLLYGDFDGNSYAYQNTGLPLTEPGTSPPPPPSGIHTATETFDSFNCTGNWTPDPAGVNTSYTRDCGNGWTAYALDTVNTGLDPSTQWSSGPVGDQNVVTLDNVNGPSAANPANPPLGAAQLYTAPDSARGELWLLKTFPVIPGQPINTLTADFRIKVTATSPQYVGVIVFDGTVTRPPSNAAYVSGVPQSSNVLASDVVRQGGSCGGWCPWNTASIGSAAVTPTHSTITVAFKVADINNSQSSFADFDNLAVSGVVTPAQANIPAGDIAQRWASTYSATGSNNMAEPAAVAIDGGNNVYVAGNSYNGSNYDIVTIKYDASGNPVWSTPAVYDGGDSDQAVGISLDSSGNIYVTGRSFQSGTDNFVAIKYNNSGLQQGTAAVFHTANKDNRPVAQALDGAGNLYVTGSSCDAGSTSTGCDYLTVKYDASLSPQWSMVYDGGGVDNAVGIGVDSNGNAYVTGTSTEPSTPGVDSIATLRYNAADGSQQWIQRTDAGSDERAVAIAVDVAGDTYVTGWNFQGAGSGTPSILTLKYDASGAEQWRRVFDDGLMDMPVAMALDSSANVYVTGVSGNVADHNIITLKYLADGTPTWERAYGNANHDDRPAAVAVDSSGNVYVTGRLSRSTGNTDFVTLRYDASGTAKNAITYDGYGLKDIPAALALGVDSQGDTVPVVVGASADTAGVDHIATVRYEKALPDLTISQVSGPSSGTVNGTIDIANTVLNIDDVLAKKHADSGPFEVGLYLAPDTGAGPDYGNMTLLGTRSISNLSPGQSSAATTTETIPSTVAEGSYYFVAVADSGGTVTEQDENNNRAASSGTIAVQGVLPDLAIPSISAPTTASAGSSFDVTVKVANIVSTGTGNVSFDVGIYACATTTITTSCDHLGSFTEPSGLAGFASDTQTVSVTAPSGTYYIGAIADDTNQVTEANENNNTGVNVPGSSSSTLLVTRADFIPGLSDPNSTSVAVVGSGSSAQVVLAKGVSWSAQSAWNTPDIGLAAKPALGDLNGDGLPDLMIGGSGGLVHAYVNTGSASSPVWTEATGANLGWNVSSACTTYNNNGTYAAPVLVDLDGDGDLDLLVGNRYGVCAYKNIGDTSAPVWQRQQSWDVTGGTTNAYYDPAVGDLDGDGKVDVILGKATGGFVAYQNTGTTTSPVWTAAPATWVSGLPTPSRASPALADLDGDGRLDLMIGDLAGNVTAYRNTGTTTSPAWTANSAWDIADPNSSSNDFAGPALADLDGDGDLDLMYGDFSGVSMGYQNTGTASPSGTYYSKVVDAGANSGFTTLTYTTTVPASTTLTVDVRAGDTTAAGDSTWTGWVTGVANGGSLSALNPSSGYHEYVQYRANLATSDVNQSPSLYSIEAGTQPPSPQQTVVSVTGGGSSGGGGGLGVLDILAMLLAAGVNRAARGRRRPRGH